MDFKTNNNIRIWKKKKPSYCNNKTITWMENQTESNMA